MFNAGTASEFKKKYEVPILNSRDADATDSVHEKGKERLAELLALVNKCIIRRTQALLTQYLPVKSESIQTATYSDAYDDGLARCSLCYHL